jgi:hypothetical protein
LFFSGRISFSFKKQVPKGFIFHRQNLLLRPAKHALRALAALTGAARQGFS